MTTTNPFKPTQVPPWLHQVLGSQTTLPDLALILLAALATVLFGLSETWSVLPPWQVALVGLLAFDIGGGVVAVQSRGTSTYYQQRPGLRWRFLVLHSAQPLLLAGLFPHYFAAILGTCSLILGFAIVVNTLSDPHRQRLLASLLVVLMLLLLSRMALPPVVEVLLSLKLVLGFAVRWPYF